MTRYDHIADMVFELSKLFYKGNKTMKIAGKLVLLCAAALLFNGQAAFAEYKVVGKQVPALELDKADGGKLSLASLKGKGIILNFWATWCGPCKKEMPTLESASVKYRDKGIVFIGVNYEQEKEIVAGFQKTYGVTFTNLLDLEGKLAESLGVIGIPMTFFIGKDGKILGVHSGMITAEEIDKWVATINGGK